MATNSVNLQINVNSAQAAAAVNQLLQQFHALNGVTVTSNPLQNIIRSAPAAASAVRGITTAMASLTAAVAAVGLAFKKGLDVNSQLENTQLGIKGIIASLFKIQTASGKLAEGPERFAIAGAEAERQLKLLRLAGMQTSAEFVDLAKAFQVALGAGAGAGLKVDEIRDLTVSLTLAAGAFSLAGDQLQSEIRAVFTGDETENSQIAGGLGLTGAQIKLWRQQGKLAEELNKRLADFKTLGAEAGKTWTSTLGNIKDGFSLLLGDVSKGAFDSLKTSLQGALATAIDPKSGDIQAAFDGLRNAANDSFTFIGDVLSQSISGGVEVAKDLSGWFTTHEAEVGAIGVTFSAVVSQVGKLLSDMGGVVAATLGWGVETDGVRSLLGGIAILVAHVRDGLTLMGGALAAVGGALVDYVGKPLRDILSQLATFFDSIPGIGSALGDLTRSAAKAIPNRGNDLLSYASKVKADFIAGKTAVNEVRKELAKPFEGGKARASATAEAERLRAAATLGGKVGGARYKKKDPDAAKKAEELKKSLEQIAKAEADADKTRFAAEQERLKAALDLQVAMRTKSKKAELDARLALELAASAKEQELAEANIRRLTAKRATEKDPAKKNDVTAELKKAEAELDALLKKNATILIRADIDKVQLQQKLNELTDSVRLDIGDLMGLSNTSVARIKSELKKLLEDPDIKSDSALVDLVKQRAALQIDAANFNTAQSELQRLQTETANQERRLELAHESGAITGIELEEQLAAARTKNVEALRAQLVVMRDLAKTSEQKAQVDSALLALDELKVKAKEVSNASREALKDDFKDAFDSVRTGAKTLGQAIGDILLSALSRAGKRASDSLVDQLFKAFDGFDFGSLFGGASGGSGGSGWGSIIAGLGSFFGFARGGYTGQGGKYEPAGIVHRDEWIVPKSAVQGLRRAGQFGMLSYINRTGRMPGYSAGGLVGSAPGQLGLSGMGGGPQTFQADIHTAPKVVISSDEMLASQVQSGQFEKQVVRAVIANWNQISKKR